MTDKPKMYERRRWATDGSRDPDGTRKMETYLSPWPMFKIENWKEVHEYTLECECGTITKLTFELSQYGVEGVKLLVNCDNPDCQGRMLFEHSEYGDIYMHHQPKTEGFVGW